MKLRGQKNLGKLIKEKDLVDTKIKLISQLENIEKAKNKIVNSMPPPKITDGTIFAVIK